MKNLAIKATNKDLNPFLNYTNGLVLPVKTRKKVKKLK